MVRWAINLVGYIDNDEHAKELEAELFDKLNALAHELNATGAWFGEHSGNVSLPYDPPEPPRDKS